MPVAAPRARPVALSPRRYAVTPAYAQASVAAM